MQASIKTKVCIHTSSDGSETAQTELNLYFLLKVAFLVVWRTALGYTTAIR